jgi:DNA-binding CsgD family transcriptional regulator
MTHVPIPALNHVIASIGKDEFGTAVYSMANGIVPFDQFTAFAFSESGRAPLAVAAEGQTKSKTRVTQSLALDYIGGEFLNDPLYRVVKSAMDNDVRVLRMLSSEFGSTSYAQHFYIDPHILTEIAIVGRRDGLRFYCGFYRMSGQEVYSDEELAAFSSIGALLLGVVSKHAELERFCRYKARVRDYMSGERREQILHHLRNILLADCPGLTRREAEVCSRIAVGYSVPAIAISLEIAPSTVATFRKRAYGKLGVSSQNELFVRYFEVVRQLQFA